MPVAGRSSPVTGSTTAFSVSITVSRERDTSALPLDFAFNDMLKAEFLDHDHGFYVKAFAF
jgi:hypothetical protein